MQTFLPFPDFVASARSLDRLRLGKQRVETLQILNALDKRVIPIFRLYIVLRNPTVFITEASLRKNV